MAGEIDGGGAPPSGGMPPGPRGRFKQPPLKGGVGAPQGPARPGSPGAPATRGAPEAAARRTPGYSTAGQSPAVADPVRAQRMAEARQAGQATLSSLTGDAQATAEFAQATKGASAKHLQSPYLPSNDLQRFATDLTYTTPAIDEPRFGAQPINEADARAFVGRATFSRDEPLGSRIPAGVPVHGMVRAFLTPDGQGQALDATFVKKLMRCNELKDNPSAQSLLKTIIKQINKQLDPQAPAAQSKPSPARSFSMQRPGVGATMQAAPSRAAPFGVALAGVGSFAAAGTSAPTTPASPSTETRTDDAFADDANGLSAMTGASDVSGAKTVTRDGQLHAALLAASPKPPPESGVADPKTMAPVSAGTSVTSKDPALVKFAQENQAIIDKYAHMPWEAFIALMGKNNFDSMLRRQLIRADSVSLTLACAMIVGSMNVQAAKDKQTMAQFDSLTQLGGLTIMYKQKLRDLNDANLDQGLKLNLRQQEFDEWTDVVNEDAKSRAVITSGLHQKISQAEALGGAGSSRTRQDLTLDSSFGWYTEGELKRLAAKGAHGKHLAEGIRKDQDDLRVTNKRAIGYVFNTQHEEAELRRRTADRLASLPEGQTAPGRQRIEELRDAARELDHENPVGGFAKVVRASFRPIMALTVINRLVNYSEFLSPGIKTFEQAMRDDHIAIRRMDAPGAQDAEKKLHQASIALDTQLTQAMAVGAQAIFHTSSPHDDRMAQLRTGGDAFTHNVNRLWELQGPSQAEGGPPSIVDRQVALGRLEREYALDRTTQKRDAMESARVELASAQQVAKDSMLFGQLSTTVSAFSAVSLAHRYEELTRWFGPNVAPADMQRWLTQGPSKDELRRAPGLANKRYSDDDLDHVLAYSRTILQGSVREQADSAGRAPLEPHPVSAGFAETTCKAQMTRHFFERKQTIENNASLAPEEKQRLVAHNETARAFFESTFEPSAAWRAQAVPTSTREAKHALKSFESEEIRNKAAYMVREGFGPGLTDREMLHNLKHLMDRAMPPGGDALDISKRTAHKLACYKSMSPMLTSESMPNTKYRRLERYNNALMQTPTSQIFSSQNDLLLGNLDSDAGELEGALGELTDQMAQDVDSTFRIIDTLNQSLSVTPGG